MNIKDELKETFYSSELVRDIDYKFSSSRFYYPITKGLTYISVFKMGKENYKRYAKELREDFVKALRMFTGNQITELEARQIALEKLNPSDFLWPSPLCHKGVRWLAMTIAREKDLYNYGPDKTEDK